MKNSSEKAVLSKFIAWAESKPDVQAVVLTSSRTKPDFIPDEFSDYDIIFVVKDIRPYLENESWLNAYGKVLAVYRDPVAVKYGFKKFCYVTQYEDSLKIDFTFWPGGLMKHMAGMKQLPNYMDDGYKVLLDKDGLARGMKAPSFNAFTLKPPTEKEYRQFVEEFFSNAPYAAKHIRRGDFFPLKFTLNFMRYEKLRKMLEWKAEIEHEWSLKYGNYGKGLSKYLSPEIIDEIENTNAVSGTEADWESLFRIIALFRKVAREVGNKLGYAYPEEMDTRVIRYLEKVKKLELP